MFIQLFYGAILIALTVMIHAICLEGIMAVWKAVSLDLEVRWRTLSFSLTVIGIFVAHIMEIAVWAFFFHYVGVLETWESAVYFSTSSFTTVGFGDLVLSQEWRLLGSIEAINGMILFGWSTAFLFAGVRRIYSHLYGLDATYSRTPQA